MRYKVLYIDDEEANLRTFHSVFRRNYDIHTALNGAEGLEILDRYQPDLIITDQYMPAMSGVEFLKRLFEKYPNRPPSRIMVSGYARADDVREAKSKYLLQYFVSKPWTREKMKMIIEKSIQENQK